MYRKFIKQVELFVSRDIRKKSKYEEVLCKLMKKITYIENCGDENLKKELKSLNKLAKQTKLMIDSL